MDEGEHLVTAHAAANRDPRVFDHPATFDIHRPNAEQHFAFGFGVHYCIGAPLARAELHAAVRHLLALPGFELAGDPVRDPLFRIRGFSSMPVKATGRLPAATEDA